MAQRLMELPVERRSSLVPRVPLQESLGLFDVGKGAGESEDEHLDKLVWVSRRELASKPGAQADLDLHRFLVLFLGRLLFATRGDTVHCRFLPLLEDLSEVGGYAWGAAFLAHQFDSLGASERQTSTSGFFPFLQVLAYLHLPALGRGDLTRPGLVPIARRWDSRRDSRNLGDQLERLQEAIDNYPYLDVVWQPPGRSFRRLHDTTDWRERAKEQIDNWERRGKAVKSDATTDNAYLQAYALKYGVNVYKSARHQVDVAGEVAMLRALLYSVVQDREAAQRQTAKLRRELERVRSTGAGGASSSRATRGSPSLLEAQLAGAVLRAEEAQRHLEERVAEATKEFEALLVQRSSVDREELDRVRAELRAQEAVSRSLQQIVMDIGRSRNRSKSEASQQGDRRLCRAVFGRFLQSAEERGGGEAPPGGVTGAILSLTQGPSISFSDKDLATPECRSLPLCLTINLNGVSGDSTLIDTGASINVCLMKTLKQLGLGEENLEKSCSTIAAYDNSKRVAKGKIALKLGVGPVTMSTEFLVLEVDPAYKAILGRPWLEQTLGVKFPFNGRVIKIKSIPILETLNAVTTEQMPHLLIPDKGKKPVMSLFDSPHLVSSANLPSLL
ncbi:hypothetical protein Taro_037188 [Colocasia esculenta]|uniref:Aminotransferase-like plant mobile domain-containing protein n=1 Tax=Colocasia esculenta TaxID=4460 RepID=A0A843WFJ3_COLES|nr:hypothetical protein [Colocasia esculenta]